MMKEELQNNIEPIWKYPELLKKHEQETNVKFSKIETKIKSEIDKISRLIDVTSSRYEKRFDLHLRNQTQLMSELTSAHTKITEDYTSRITSIDENIDSRFKELDTKLKNLDTSVHKIKLFFDKQPNSDVLIRFYNTEGELQRVRIQQPELDENTICYKNNKVTLKYIPDENTFKFSNDKFYSTALLREDGSVISGDDITNCLTNNLQKVSTAVDKVDTAVSKLESMNGYAASNDFKTSTPTNEQLTKFATSCFTNNGIVSSDRIPNGTKIKNTFDNHVWIFNRINIDGLITFKWEDFGCDSVSIAKNNGVCGIVSGSQDKYRGFIDVNGVISINSLEETLDILMKSIELLQKDFEQFKGEISAKLNQSSN